MTTLPARYFTDEERYRRELEAFYFQSWICAGRADRIAEPGDGHLNGFRSRGEKHL